MDVCGGRKAMEKRLADLGLALVPLLTGGVFALRAIARTAPSQDTGSEIPIVFDPALDEAVNWALDASIQLELEHSEIDRALPGRQRGEAMFLWQGLAEVGDTISVSWAGRFAEKAPAVDEVRPIRFEREWDSLTLDVVRTGEYIREPKKVHLDSKLFAETIRYEWRPKSGAYETTRLVGAGKLESEILESLHPEDISLHATLPSRLEEIRSGDRENLAGRLKLVRQPDRWRGETGTGRDPGWPARNPSRSSPWTDK